LSGNRRATTKNTWLLRIRVKCAQPRTKKREANRHLRMKDLMKNIFGVSLALIAGIGLGAVRMRVVHAQSTPPAYVIDQIKVSNLDAYIKEFGPLASKAIEVEGGKYLVRGGKTAEIEGEPPKGRVVLIAVQSLEQARTVEEQQQVIATQLAAASIDPNNFQPDIQLGKSAPIRSSGSKTRVWAVAKSHAAWG
jgi:uncharacterized protein (DUF1330 family)